jgi:predicted RNA-binding protein with PUA-like domain
VAGARWLLKSEPEVYPWAQLVADGHTTWDGVRNHQARNALAAMAVGDLVLFYHSHDAEVVGIARVRRSAFPDPTADDPRWLAVELEPVSALDSPVPLEAIKADRELATLKLVTQSRLSVMPVEPAQYERILRLAKGGARPATPRSAAAKPRSRGAGPRSRPRADRR